MKNYIFLILIVVFPGCQMNKQEQAKQAGEQHFFVGTYTGPESEGIYKYALNKDGALQLIGLAAKTNNPSFLAWSPDKKYIVAVSEIDRKGGESAIKSFSIQGDTLVAISESPSGGAHPCFVAVNKEGYVLAANYTGGNVGLLKLNDKGELSGLLNLQQHQGSGITKRQQAPHAHSAWFNPAGNDIISVDLGSNELWFSQLDTTDKKLTPSDPYKLRMAPGAGPRHLTFHPNNLWIYVLNELDCTITLVQKNELGNYEAKVSISTLPENYTEPNTCADIHHSSDGKFIYASNRGHNSIVIFEVDFADGSLSPVSYESTHGETPRNFSLTPDNKYLLVANQNSDNITSFKRNTETGLLTYLAQIEAPNPVCILF